MSLLATLISVDALVVSPPRACRAAPRAEAAMTIAVFGASGGCGSEAVLQAVERGEAVSALVRDRTKLRAPRSAGGLTEGSSFPCLPRQLLV